MAAGFADLLMNLEQADFFIGLLPFVITYAIFFLTLRNSPKFGEDNAQARRMSALVSLAIAFFVSYFVVSSSVYSQFFVTYFGTLTVGLLGIMGLLIAFALTGLHDYVPGRAFWAIPVVILVAAAWTVAGGFSALVPGGLNPVGQSVLIPALDYMINTGLIWGVLIIAVVIWATREPQDDQPTLAERLFADLSGGGGSGGES